MDVLIQKALQFRRLVSHDEGVHEQKQLRLTPAEVAQEPHEMVHVAFLLPDFDGRRMFTRAREPWTVVGALNLDEPLGAAADGADLFRERGTATPPPADTAEGTEHTGIIVQPGPSVRAHPA